MSQELEGQPFESARPAFLFVAVLAAALIWILLLRPVKPSKPDFLMKLLHNGGHAFLFAILTWPLLSGLPRRRSCWLPACILTMLYAGATELAQWKLAGRIPSWGDFIIDCTGIVLGYVLVRLAQGQGRAALRRGMRDVLLSGILCFVAALFESLR